MSAASVIADAAALGVHLWREGDRLRFRAPVGALSPALRERIEGCRAELLAIVADLTGPPV